MHGNFLSISGSHIGKLEEVIGANNLLVPDDRAIAMPAAALSGDRMKGCDDGALAALQIDPIRYESTSSTPHAVSQQLTATDSSPALLQLLPQPLPLVDMYTPLQGPTVLEKHMQDTTPGMCIRKLPHTP